MHTDSVMPQSRKDHMETRPKEVIYKMDTHKLLLGEVQWYAVPASAC